jgi:hypothetical protein
MQYNKWLSRKDMFALEAMKVILGVHSDQDMSVVAWQAFTVADGLVEMLDAPMPGEGGSSILSEFDESSQGVADAVLGRGEVSVPADGSLQVDIGVVGEEFL